MELLGILAAVAVAIKVLERRLPRGIYRFGTAIYVLTPLAGMVYAMWLLWGSWLTGTELSLFLGFAFLTGIGTGVGYHRLLTHRSFETSPAVKLALLACGAMALPTSCVDFAANHLKHHAFSDREGDPHSPLDGLLHAHVGWIFRNDPADRERYARHLADDPVVRFIDRTPMVWFGLGLLVPYLIGGWHGLLWGGFVRLAYHNHVTFAVNSICHTFGARPFETRDESRNNWLIGLLAFGEGWHNNHHAFPAMAYHGMTWRQVDLNGLVIRGLAALGLAWSVKQPSPALVQRRRRAALMPAEREAPEAAP